MAWRVPGRIGLAVQSGYTSGYLIITGANTAREQLTAHHHDIEFCSLEELPARLEAEREQFDGNGIGDPPGRHQRRGVSELR